MTVPDFLEQTRSSYDIVAADYTRLVQGELAKRPVDRALLAAFAEVVQAGDVAAIADVGCGPGRVTRHLADLGTDAFGIDLSPGMIRQARASYPELRFAVGSMLDLPLPDASLGGLVAWYSIIHVPDVALPDAFAEFHRVLCPGGQLLLAFQIGDEIMHRSEFEGHDISLDSRRRRLDDVAVVLAEAGFDVRLRLHREPATDPDYPEKTPQGFVLAQRETKGAVAE